MSRIASIYLDYAATTPLDPRVATAMQAVGGSGGVVANPASGHPAGRAAAAAVARAQTQVLASVNAPNQELIWTSGATEADNLAILGYAHALLRRGDARHRILIAATEHAAVTAAAEAARALGFAVEYLPVHADGLLDLAALREALDERVALVSVAHVNNETGVIQPLAPIAAAVHDAGARLHVDAAQGGGRLPLDIEGLAIDMVSLSAHKFYGPKGVGALCHRPAVRLEPLLHGGGQQAGMRSGTLPVELVVGMGAAFALPDSDAERQRLAALQARLRSRLAELGGVVCNGRDDGSPHVLNVAFAGVHGGALREALSELNVGFGSACSSGGQSPVLRAMGRPDALAHAAVRFSLGRFTTRDEIDRAASEVAQVVQSLRRISPAWRALCEGATPEQVYGCTTPLSLA